MIVYFTDQCLASGFMYGLTMIGHQANKLYGF